MNIPELYKNYVKDYEVMVFDVAYLQDEIIEKFTSDFKLIARFFKNRRLGKQNIFNNENICHVQEFIDFLSVFTNDKRYTNIKLQLVKMENDARIF